MKLKENWKRFWTLDRHHAEGFTLVELIVVIATLAILGSVAVPAYSGYITRTNMTADQTLASEVAHALQLQYYANPEGFTGKAYVVLDTTGAKTNDPFSVDAMQKAFGDSWSDTALKYGGWTDASTMLNLIKDNQHAESFNGSTYVDGVGTETLLGDVQYCASSLSGFLANLNQSEDDYSNAVGSLTKYFGTDPEFNQNLINAGYNSNDGSGITSDTLSNATVFAIANNLADSTKADTTIYDFGNGTYILNGLGKNTNDPDLLYEAANWYAATEAFVNYMGNDFPDLKTQFQLVNDSFATNNPGAIIGQMDAFSAYVVQEMQGSDSTFYTKLYAYLDPSAGKSQAQMDGEAYVGIMTSVDGLAGDYTSAERNQLNRNNLFADQDVLGRLDSLMTAASLKDLLTTDPILMAALNEANGSMVIIVLTVSQDGNITYSICPATAGNQ